MNRFSLRKAFAALAMLLLGTVLFADSVVSKRTQTLSWSTNLSYKASLFSSIEAGSAINLAYTNTKDSYHKFKLYAQTPGWTTLGAGSISGAKLENGEITPSDSSGTISYTVTAAEADALKRYGMAMNGFGIKISRISISPAQNGGTGSAASAGASAVVYDGGHDLANWSFVSIDKARFASVRGGTAISFVTGASPSVQNPNYLNIKLYSGTWQPLFAGTVAGNAAKTNDLIIPAAADGSFTYTVTEAEAAAIRESGLIVQGYAMSVRQVSLGAGSADTVSTGTGGAASQSGTTASSGTSAANPAPASKTGTPFANHGALHVSGATLYDKNNKPYQLYGMSTHGINFGQDFSRYVNKEAFATLRDDWNTNCIRLVLYPRDYNGYCAGGNQSQLKQLICDGIDYATELGMYVIVDWHVHNYNPQETKEAAKTFLAEISARYANYGNVLYEICNEPTNSPWNSAIKPYSEDVIPVIRKNAPDAIVIVGTNTWSQDIEGPLANPLSFKNVMYTFHFYAQTHTESFRSRVERAVRQGLPVFITEFGTCDASGNGGFNAAQSQQWFELLKRYQISHCNWSLCNKGETASAIASWCSKTSGWAESDLTESGRLVRSHFRTLSR